MIYNHFRSVFEIIKKSENTIITDFKLGENEKGEPLRWKVEAAANATLARLSARFT